MKVNYGYKHVGNGMNNLEQSLYGTKKLLRKQNIALPEGNFQSTSASISGRIAMNCIISSSPGLSLDMSS